MAEAPMIGNQARLQELAAAIAETKAKIDEERLTKRTYSHMLHRMECDYIATKIKSTELEQSLKNKKEVLGLEEEK